MLARIAIAGIVLLFNPLSATPTKWSNTLKQFVGKLPANCLSVFDHFVDIGAKGLMWIYPIRVFKFFMLPKSRVKIL